MAPYRSHIAQATDEFCNFFDSNCELGTISVFPGRENETASYLPDSARDDYFTLACVKQTLHQLYSDRGPGWLPVQPSAVQNNCKKVLAILLYIGQGHRIEYFVYKPELYDAKLPFLDRPPSFPDNTADPFFDDFQKAQWKFCAPKIDNSRRVDWDHRCILPFVRIGKPLGQGHSGKVYKIKVHPAHDRLDQGTAANTTRNSQTPNEYVLKTFHPRPDSEAVWGHEVEAHIALREAQRPDKGIVWFHNCYTHGETCNVILELAPCGDLESLLVSLKRPTTNEDIMLFWRRFLRLLETLAFLRNMRYNDKSAYQLCHFDIKPRNILVYPGETNAPYDLHFKIGDFGSSNFQVMRNDSHAYTEYFPGTRTFGAPECYNWNPFSDEMRTPQNVLPDADMWSFGAIAAEIATWMHSGSAGIKIFRGWRQTTLSANQNFQVADCFHNGKDVLDCVDMQLEELMNDAGPKNAAVEVIRLIRKHMLVAKPENRMNARDLQFEADNALNTVQQRMDATRVLPDTNKTGRSLNQRRTVSLGKQFPQNPGNGRYPLNQATQSAPDAIVGSPTDTWQSTGQHPDFKIDPASIEYPSSAGNSSTTGSSGYRKRPMQLGSNNPYRRRPATMPVIHQDLRSSDSFMDRNAPEQHSQQHQTSDDGRNLLGDRREDSQAHRLPCVHGVAVSNGIHPASKSLAHGKNPWSLNLTNNVYHDPLGIDIDQSQQTRLIDQSSIDAAPLLDGVETPILDPERSSGPSLNNFENTVDNDKSRNGKMSVHIPNSAIQEGGSGLQHKRSPDVPFLSYDQANVIIRSTQDTKGKLRRHGRGGKLEEATLKEYENRDFVILVDDSTSMRAHRSQVVDCAKLLANFTTPYDDNGVELRFMSEYKSKTTTKDVQKIRDLVEDHQPKEKGPVFSRVNDVLDFVLGGYRERLEKERSKLGKMLKLKVKTLIVFVLTDGEFGYCDASGPIQDLVSTLREQKRPSNQVGVQFVRFGTNPEAKARLDVLDDFLNPNVNRALANDPDNKDIVDVESWDGVNVWKLLLGSIDRLYDRSDLPYQLTPAASPVAESALQSPVPLDGQAASFPNAATLRGTSDIPSHRRTYPSLGSSGYQH